MQGPIEWRTGVVRAIRDLTRDIRELVIAAEGDFRPPTPGAHLKIAVMANGRPDARSYSIVGAAEGAYRIAVKKVDPTRGGSAYMWSLSSGARVRVSGPDNHFHLVHGRPRYLLIAGGVGVTAIVAHALALAKAGASLRVACAARTRADFAFADELRSALGDSLALFASDEGARIDIEEEFAALPAESEAYVCGPIGMLEEAKRAWRASQRPSERLRFETFGNSGAWPSASFRARVPRLGQDLFVPAGKTLLEVLEDAGVGMIFDCRKGECGLCALPILDVDGVVDHRDVFFNEEEKAANTKLCTCVSRVYGKSITLDTADR